MPSRTILKKNKYKAAILGCGKVAGSGHSPDAKDIVYSHAAGYYYNQEIDLCAACDTNRPQLLKFTETWAIPQKYTDAENMLAQEEIDILSISSPTTNHQDHLILALENKIPVILCEKPVTETLSQAVAVSELLSQSSSQVVVNYFRRFNPSLIELRRLLQENHFGKTERITVYYNKGFLHNGGHFIDFIRWCFGNFSTVVAVNNYPFGPFQEDLCVDVHCMLESGIPVVFLAADHKNYNILEIDILTSKGRIRLPNTGRSIQTYSTKQDNLFKYLHFLEPQHNNFENPWKIIFQFITNHLTRILQKEEEPTCNFFDGMYCLAVVEAVKESFLKNHAISVREILERLPPLTIDRAESPKTAENA